MQHKEKQFLKLFHNNLVGMLLTGTDHRIVDVNEKLLQISGLSREKIIGKTGLELGLFDKQFLNDLWTEYAEKGTVVDREFALTRYDGNVIHVLFSSEPVELDGAAYRLLSLMDITKRKEAEDQIRESEIRFRTLASHAPVGIFETDAEGKTTYVNETWSKFTGIPLSQAINDKFLAIIHPDDREEQVRNWMEKVKNREPSYSEYRIINDAGEIRWINGNAIPLIGADGSLLGYLGTITDVTEIKHAIQKLKKSEDDLQMAQHTANIGSWQFDITTGELLWSDELHRLFELEGCPPGKLYTEYRKKIHQDDLPDLDAAIQRAVGQKIGYTIEHRIVCRTGEIKYIRGIARVLLDENGEVVGLKGTGQDITEAKQQEILTQESLKKLDTLINTVEGIVWETNVKKNRFTYVSHKAEAVLGYPVENWLTDEYFWTNHLHPDDRERALEFDKKHTRLKKNYEFEYRMIASNGNVVWLRDLVSVVVENDQPVQLRGIMIDISSKKHSEWLLEERTRQLSELSAHLQKVREEERTKIAREIHDELGQQLTGLKMDIAWLQKKVTSRDPAVSEKFKGALLLLDETVRSIRRISTELRPSVIDDLGFNAALEWLVEEFSERLAIRISYQNDFDDKNINPNVSIGLFRILQESLTNIARHAKARNIDVLIRTQHDVIQLLITDDGVGFDTGAQKNRLSFGLVGIKERTISLFGECDIVSVPGRGTRVDVRIPLMT